MLNDRKKQPNKIFTSALIAQGITPNLIAFLKGNTRISLTVSEIKTGFDHRNVDLLLKNKNFIKRYEFLRTITIDDLQKPEIKEVIELFMQTLNCWDAKNFLYERLPVAVTCAIQKSLNGLISLFSVTENPRFVFEKIIHHIRTKKEKDVDVRTVKSLVSDMKKYNMSTEDWISIRSFIDMVLRKEPGNAVEFLNHIPLDETQIQICIVAFKANESFINGTQHDFMVSDLLSLFKCFYAKETYIAFLIEYLQVTDHKEEKAKKICSQCISILENAENKNEIIEKWLPLLAELLKYPETLNYYIEKIIFSAGGVVSDFFKIEDLLAHYGEMSAYKFSDDAFKSFKRQFVGKENNIKLEQFLIAKLKKDLETEKSKTFTIVQVYKNTNVNKVLVLGVSAIEQLAVEISGNDIYHMGDYLDIIKKKDIRSYKKVKNVFLKENLLERCKENDRSKITMIIEHFTD